MANFFDIIKFQVILFSLLLLPSYLELIAEAAAIDFMQNGAGLDPKIIKVPAEPDEAPFAVALYSDHDYLCTFSIITAMTTIGAASCIYPYRSNLKFHGVVGATDLPNGRNSEEIEFRRVYIHEWYDPKSLRYDIATALTLWPLRWTRSVQPICLPHPEVDYNDALAIMYRFRIWSAPAGGSYSNDLNKMPVRLISLNECQAFSYGYQPVPEKDHICSAFDRELYTCLGDSGAPVVYETSSGHRLLVAIHTIRQQDKETCGLHNKIGLNIEIRQITEWINAHKSHRLCFEK